MNSGKYISYLFPDIGPRRFATLLSGGSGAAPTVTRLLDDQFTDTVAAGSVNATTATPGGQTRNVVDTGNKMSIGMGVLKSVGYTTQSTDPRIYYGSYTRAAGLAFAFDVKSVNSLADCVFIGFATDTTGVTTTFNHALYINTEVRYWNGSVITGLSGTIVVNTQRKYIIVLRSTGAYLIEVSADLQTFTLLYVDAANNDATLYPVAGVRTTGTINYDNFAIGQLGGGWVTDDYSGASVPLEITGVDKQWLQALCCG